MQNSLSRKSSTTWKQSKTFSPAGISQSQIINNMEIFKVLFGPQNCFSRKSSLSRKNSKTFSSAEISQTQINDTLKLFKDFVTGRKILAANHQQYGNIQKPFTCRIHLAANHQQPGKIQSLFHLQNCLGRKSLKS